VLDFDKDDLGIPDKPEPKPISKPKSVDEMYPAGDSPIKRRHYELRELAQHSSNSVEHYTPIEIVNSARQLMRGIDLDPASSYVAQQRIKAQDWYGIKQDGSRTDGLMVPWYGKVWLNPPGGLTSKHAPHLCSISKSYACIWWGKLMSEWQAGNIEQACFLGFTLELLQSIQKLGVGFPLQFPTVFFAKRIPFDYPEDTKDGLPIGETEIKKGTDPTHANFLTWIPGRKRRDAFVAFVAYFENWGYCSSGDMNLMIRKTDLVCSESMDQQDDWHQPLP
jgi:hypothetical protein